MVKIALNTGCAVVLYAPFVYYTKRTLQNNVASARYRMAVYYTAINKLTQCLAGLEQTCVSTTVTVFDMLPGYHKLEYPYKQ